MKPSVFSKSLILLGSICATLLLSTRADAMVLMLDFGPEPSTDAETNSPYHTANPSFTGTTWNQLQTSDVASGLLYADGTAATGVSVNLGTETSGVSDTISFLTNPPNSGLDGRGANGTADSLWFKSGIFADNSVGKDGVWGDIYGAAVGLRVDGLAAGTYEIYVVGFNTNVNTGGQQMNLYSSAGSSADSFDIGGLTANTSAITNNVAWTQGENYALATVTLGEDESLYIATDIAGFDNPRGFLNSVQIVQIPEPGVAVLFLSALGGLAIFRRRRA